MEGESLFIFSVGNPIRRVIYNLVNKPLFDNIILLLILLSTILIAVENPLNDPNSEFSTFFYFMDKIITVSFIMEMCLKIVAFGFLFNGKESYLRDSWNQMDFFIVLISLSEFFIDNGVSVLKLFRIIRALKPLKLVTTNQRLKIAVSSLIASLKDIMSAIAISLTFFLIFSIVYVNYFKGEMNICSYEESIFSKNHFTDVFECFNHGGAWERRNFNYDNVFQAMLSLFTMAITVGWAEFMYQTQKVTAEG
jgi:hypothetical protein